MFEVQMLIPLADNDGETFTAEHHAAFEAAILDSFGGFSRLPVTVVGGWQNAAGVVFSDATRAYIIAVVSIADGGKVAALARFAKAFYLQEAIYVRFLGVVEII